MLNQPYILELFRKLYWDKTFYPNIIQMIFPSDFSKSKEWL